MIKTRNKMAAILDEKEEFFVRKMFHTLILGNNKVSAF